MNPTTFAIPFLLSLLLSFSSRQHPNGKNFIEEQAIANSQQANIAFIRSQRFVNGWLRHADPLTGLTPQTLNDSINRDIWDAQDCAADCYPFMVSYCQLN
jgi:hypothetical protein